jgi:hypothetical protein
MRRQRTEQKNLTTGYVCNCNVKEITILFCKQIGRSPNTKYSKCRMGLRERKMEMAGNSFSSRPIFVSQTPCRQAVGLTRLPRLPQGVEGGEDFVLNAWLMLG